MALWAFVRRWGWYGVVAALLIGGGGSSTVASVAGVAAWTVLPLLRVASRPGALAGVALAQAALGGLLVWAMRPLLWQARWRDAERALPIPPRDLWRSDATVVALGLLPLLTLYALGAATWWAARPAWLLPFAGWAAAGWCAMVLGSWVAGVIALQAWRRAGRAGPVARASAALGRGQPWLGWAGPRHYPARAGLLLAGRAGLRHYPGPWFWALPLWRGPARRTGAAALLGGLVLAGWVLGGALWGPRSGLAAWVGWWLAGFAAAGLTVTTRVNQLSRAEYQPLLQACGPLPLSPRGLQARRAAWALTPLLAACLLLAAALPWPALRAPVAGAYLAANLAASAWEVAQPGTDPAARASRWGVWLVLLVALATEVTA